MNVSYIQREWKIMSAEKAGYPPTFSPFSWLLALMKVYTLYIFVDIENMKVARPEMLYKKKTC